MKLTLLFLIAIWILDDTYGWVSVEKSDNGKGGCKSSNPNVGELKLNEVKTPKGVCIRAECKPNGEIHYHGCGHVDKLHESKCKVTDLSKEYPDCCKENNCGDKPAEDAKSP